MLLLLSPDPIFFEARPLVDLFLIAVSPESVFLPIIIALLYAICLLMSNLVTWSKLGTLHWLLPFGKVFCIKSIKSFLLLLPNNLLLIDWELWGAFSFDPGPIKKLVQLGFDVPLSISVCAFGSSSATALLLWNMWSITSLSPLLLFNSKSFCNNSC